MNKILKWLKRLVRVVDAWQNKRAAARLHRAGYHVTTRVLHDHTADVATRVAYYAARSGHFATVRGRHPRSVHRLRESLNVLEYLTSIPSPFGTDTPNANAPEA